MHIIAQTESTISFVDIFGWLPLLLAAVAILIGITALIARSGRFIQAAIILESSVAVWGMAITFWRLYAISSAQVYEQEFINIDPVTWHIDFSLTWTAAACTLTGVAIGLILIAIANLFKKLA